MSTSTARKRQLIRRLRYLWTFELFDSFFLPAVVLWCAHVLKTEVGSLTVYASLLVALLLWQGAAYWWLKLRAVKRGSTILATHLRIFARLKGLNWLLLAVAGVWLGVRVGALMAAPGSRALWFDVIAGSALVVLAALEQVNYYYYQLMYDCPEDWRYLKQHRKLKRSSLSRSLSKAEEEPSR